MPRAKPSKPRTARVRAAAFRPAALSRFGRQFRQPGKARLFLFALLAGLLAGSVYAYASRAHQQPEGILKSALVKTLQVPGSGVSLFWKDDMNATASAKIQLDGKASPDGRFDLAGRYTAANAQSIGLAVRSIDGKDAYLQMSGVSRLGGILGDKAKDYGITQQRNPLLPLDGKWLVVPAYLKEMAVKNRPSSGKGAYNLTEGDQLTIATLYQRHEFLSVSKTFPDSEVGSQIDPQKAHHYRVAINADRLRTYLQSLKREIPHLQLTDVQVGSMVASARTVRDLQVWIGQEDMYIHRVQFDRQIGDKRSSVLLRLHDIGDPIQVIKPEGTVELFEALTGLLNR